MKPMHYCGVATVAHENPVDGVIKESAKAFLMWFQRLIEMSIICHLPEAALNVEVLVTMSRENRKDTATLTRSITFAKICRKTI